MLSHVVCYKLTDVLDIHTATISCLLLLFATIDSSQHISCRGAYKFRSVLHEFDYQHQMS